MLGQCPRSILSPAKYFSAFTRPIRAGWKNRIINKGNYLQKVERYVRSCCMGHLFCNYRLVCGRTDWIAVRRYDTNCPEITTTWGRSWSRICDTDNRTLWVRVAFVSSSKRSIARYHIRRSYFGSHGFCWSSVHNHGCKANENTNRI